MPPPKPPRLVARTCVSALLLAGASVVAQTTPATPPPPAAGAANTRAENVDLVRDASVQESVSRSTNVDFESVRVDGQRSNTALSALSADQVLSVESTKVPTPDLDADAVGGLLRVTTRRAYDQAKRTLRGEITAGYGELTERFVPNVSVTYGNAFGPDRAFGFLGTLQYEREQFLDEAIELDWNRTGTELQEFEADWRRDEGNELNFNGTLDWKLGPESFAFVRVDGSFENGTDRGYELNYELEDAPAEPPAAGVVLTDSTARRSIRGGKSEEYTATLSTGLTLKGDLWTAEFKANHTEGATRSPERFNYEFQHEGISLLYRRIEAAFPTVVAPNPGAAVSPADYRLNELEVSEEDQGESDTVASLDFRRENILPGRPSWMKFGAKTRFLSTDNEETHTLFTEGPSGFRLGDAAATGDTRTTLDGRYRFTDFPSLASLEQARTANPGRAVFNLDRTRGETDPANYEVSQDVMAAYAMLSAGFGPTRLLAGVRVEKTDNAFEANEVIFDDNGRYEATLRRKAESSYTNWFPGLHATHAVSDRLTLFASWTQSLIRPEYTDLVPSRRIQRSNRDIEEGNPDLKATLYTNYDAAVDFEYADGAKLAVQVFHREIEDPVLERTILLADGPFAGYDRSRPENAGAASLTGVDVTLEQELGELVDALDGASVEVTYTYQRSEQELAGRTGSDLPLADEPEHALNAALTYERGLYELNLQAEYEGRALRSAGRAPTEDTFTRSATRWEATISRRIGAKGRLFFEVENLTAEPEFEFQGDESRPSAYELSLREYRLGFRWEL